MLNIIDIIGQCLLYSDKNPSDLRNVFNLFDIYDIAVSTIFLHIMSSKGNL